jgi:drug/metabolite transporter (DMT)-like permease
MSLAMMRAVDRGVVLMLMASMSFAVMGGFAKVLSESLPPLEVTFFRNLTGVLLVGFTLWRRPLRQTGGRPWLLLFRGTMGFLALVAYFYLMAHIPLGEAATYNKTSPIFVAIFAYLFLQEKLPRTAIFAIIVGFAGIVLVAKPDGMALDKYDLLGIFSGIGAALAYTSIRELRKHYDTRAIVLSFMGVGTLGPILLMSIAPYVDAPELDFLVSAFVVPAPKLWWLIAGVGLFATLSQYWMTQAYALTQAGIVGTVSYSNIIFAVCIGLALGDPLPDLWTVLGIILVILAGLLVSLPTTIVTMRNQTTKRAP